MDEEMTKARLIETLQTKRAEWDALLAQVPEERMVLPGAAGTWSVKDVIAHITDYERWMADRMHEQLRGEIYAPSETDMMHFDQRNALRYLATRDLPLETVRAQSQEAFQRLEEAVQAHSEQFLLEPQQFAGAPQPITIWKMLRSEVYGHYDEHIPSIQAWIDAAQ
jgi:uncharacterized damage-inducible protein DinB